MATHNSIQAGWGLGFASPRKKGQKPYLPGMLIRWHLRPAAKMAGVEGPVGWHTFQRTVATLLVANGEDVKTVQESLRHANSKVTLDLYAQAVMPAKRKAQSKIVRMLLPGSGEAQKSPGFVPESQRRVVERLTGLSRMVQ